MGAQVCIKFLQILFDKAQASHLRGKKKEQQAREYATKSLQHFRNQKAFEGH